MRAGIRTTARCSGIAARSAPTAPVGRGFSPARQAVGWGFSPARQDEWRMLATKALEWLGDTSAVPPGAGPGSMRPGAS
jgi:hypothetical protein